MKKEVKKHGFTLAEVLITLGIIGVVAAMTLPNVINKINEKHWHEKAKKAYSVASQALENYKNEEGGYYGISTLQLKNILAKQIRITKDYGLDGRVTWSYHSTIYKSLLGNPADTSLLDEGQFVTSDGMFWGLQNSSYVSFPILISVDINGVDRGPNVWGRDLYTFQVTSDGFLKPMGAQGTYYPAKNYCRRDIEQYNVGPIQGIGCMYYVMMGIKY